MSEHTDPTWALILWILLGAFGIGLLYTVLAVPIACAVGRAFKAGQQDDDDRYGPAVLYGPTGDPIDLDVDLRRGVSL